MCKSITSGIRIRRAVAHLSRYVTAQNWERSQTAGYIAEQSRGSYAKLLGGEGALMHPSGPDGPICRLEEAGLSGGAAATFNRHSGWRQLGLLVGYLTATTQFAA